MAVWEFKSPTAITPKMELKGHKSVPRAIDPNDPDSPNAKNKDLNRSSPDMNLIENIWGSMKKYMYLRTTVRPGNIEELKAGVKDKYCWTSQVGALHVS